MRWVQIFTTLNLFHPLPTLYFHLTISAIIIVYLLYANSISPHYTQYRVNSVVRSEMGKANLDGFRFSVTPWTKEFRVLFASSGVSTLALDPSVHYIFNGTYVATVRGDDGFVRWTCVIGIEKSLETGKKWMLSNEASPANVAALREYLCKNCPQVMELFPDDSNLISYFSRRTFKGAVVTVNRLHYDEWILLMGDAAHSVLPPTGEGIPGLSLLYCPHCPTRKKRIATFHIYIFVAHSKY